MSSTSQAFCLLLAAPPSLRSVVARKAFAIGATRALATNTAPVSGYDHTFTRTHKYTGHFIPRTCIKLHRSAPLSTSTQPVASSASSSTTSSTSLPPSTPSPAATASTSSPGSSPSRFRRFLLSTSLVFIFFATGFSMAAAPAAQAVTDLLNGPTDAETLELYEAPTPTLAAINQHIVEHPLAQRLRQDASFTETRPHLKIAAGNRPHNLMVGTLIGEERIGVPPLCFFEKGAALPRAYQIFYLGADLCGHPGIVHGGLLATLLDEGLARACFSALPNKVAVTANLNINYRIPVKANQYVVLKVETTKVEGRKAWTKGWIEALGDEDGDGKKLVEAEALFIEPKGAKTMASLYANSA